MYSATFRSNKHALTNRETPHFKDAAIQPEHRANVLFSYIWHLWERLTLFIHLCTASLVSPFILHCLSYPSSSGTPRPVGDWEACLLSIQASQAWLPRLPRLSTILSLPYMRLLLFFFFNFLLTTFPTTEALHSNTLNSC